ncbi:MAG: hypothetical protein PVH03_11735 [Chloroflexota bacterium]|jgi:hypothetical protein
MPIDISEIRTGKRPESRDVQGSHREISQELAKKVADRVYEMLLQEMRIDYERGRSTYGIRYLFRGGR